LSGRAPPDATAKALWQTVAVAIAGKAMPRYIGFDTGAERQDAPRTALLLVNLGTPAAPTTDAVGEYLAEFLSDPRVVELPRWLWWPVLHGYILRTRPRRSAEAYAKIWRDDGSPLQVFSERLAEAVRTRIEQQTSGKVEVALAMTYGEPAVGVTIEALMAKGVRRVLVLPLFPQYSATSTGAALDAVARVTQKLRWPPELRTVGD
jgi:ferrochelatase